MDYDLNTILNCFVRFKHYLQQVKILCKQDCNFSKEQIKLIKIKCDMLVNGIVRYAEGAEKQRLSAHFKTSNNSKYEMGKILPQNILSEVAKVARETMDYMLENEMLMKMASLMQKKQTVGCEQFLGNAINLYTIMFATTFYINEIGCR